MPVLYEIFHHVFMIIMIIHASNANSRMNSALGQLVQFEKVKLDVGTCACVIHVNIVNITFLIQ